MNEAAIQAAVADSVHYEYAREVTAKMRAESECADARLELAQHAERIAMLLCQHEPVASLGIDRERLRALLKFIRHGDLKRLAREVEALQSAENVRSGNHGSEAP